MQYALFTNHQLPNIIVRWSGFSFSMSHAWIHRRLSEVLILQQIASCSRVH